MVPKSWYEVTPQRPLHRLSQSWKETLYLLTSSCMQELAQIMQPRAFSFWCFLCTKPTSWFIHFSPQEKLERGKTTKPKKARLVQLGSFPAPSWQHRLSLFSCFGNHCCLCARPQGLNGVSIMETTVLKSEGLLQPKKTQGKIIRPMSLISLDRNILNKIFPNQYDSKFGR